MKKILFVLLFSLMITNCFAQQTGQLIRGRSPSGQYPLIAVEEDGTVKTTGGSGSSSTSSSTIDALEYGLYSEGIKQISTSTVTPLLDITSGTSAPFWVTLRNIGDKTIHYSNNTPTNNSDGIAVGEQIVLKFATNTPRLKFLSNSSGISSLSHNIWK